MKKPKKNYWEERSRMSNIPKLRFPEFSGEWEEKRIDSIFDEKKEKNHPSEEVLTIIQGTGTVPRKASGRNIIFDEKSLSSYKFVQKDDFIIHLRSFEGGLEIANSNGIVSPAYIIMHPILSIASKFYYSYFRSYKFINHVLPVSVEGVRDGRQIKYPILKEEKIPFTSFAEQQKIADFLSNVDSIITAETKILKTLQKKKKALMQKLFTRQLRFKSDDGKDFPAWEEKKLGEIAIFSKGNGYSKSDLVSNGTPIILYGRLYTKYETSISEVDTFVLEKKNSVISKGDEIIVPASGETAEDISRASVVKHAGIILGGDLNIIEVDLNHYIPEYIALCISNGEPKKRMAKLAQGKTIVHLHNSDLQQLIFSIPCKAEQQKIADCLSSIDSLIQTQQKVVTTWQQRKKALLQQMFI